MDQSAWQNHLCVLPMYISCSLPINCIKSCCTTVWIGEACNELSIGVCLFFWSWSDLAFDPTSLNIEIDLYFIMFHLCAENCFNLWTNSWIVAWNPFLLFIFIICGHSAIDLDPIGPLSKLTYIWWWYTCVLKFVWSLSWVIVHKLFFYIWLEWPWSHIPHYQTWPVSYDYTCVPKNCLN